MTNMLSNILPGNPYVQNTCVFWRCEKHHRDATLEDTRPLQYPGKTSPSHVVSSCPRPFLVEKSQKKPKVLENNCCFPTFSVFCDSLFTKKCEKKET